MGVPRGRRPRAAPDPQRADRERDPDRLHVGPPARAQAGPDLVGQRAPTELPAPADGSHDQHLPARGPTADADEIVAQTPRGVYVAQLGGGQVNTATGDFVFGMTAAFMIENGQITAPLRDCNLIGNGPRSWLGSTPWRRLLNDPRHLRQERPERAGRHGSGDDAPQRGHDCGTAS